MTKQFLLRLLAAAVLCFLSLVLLIWPSQYLAENGTTIRAEPNVESKALFEVKPGEEVMLSYPWAENEWHHTMFTDSIEGYVDEDEVEKLTSIINLVGLILGIFSILYFLYSIVLLVTHLTGSSSLFYLLEPIQFWEEFSAEFLLRFGHFAFGCLFAPLAIFVVLYYVIAHHFGG